MISFQVGDKVKIRQGLKVGSLVDGLEVYESMLFDDYATVKTILLKTDEITIMRLFDKYGDDIEYHYTSGMLEPKERKGITEFSTGAVRDTSDGKPPMDLIPWDLMGRVALWYGRGADKYGKNNWRKGQKKSHTFASLIRHAMKYWQGATDEDHLSAVIWNAFSLMNVDTYFKDNTDINDLEGK